MLVLLLFGAGAFADLRALFFGEAASETEATGYKLVPVALLFTAAALLGTAFATGIRGTIVGCFNDGVTPVFGTCPVDAGNDDVRALLSTVMNLLDIT